jgi:hypothetical protein
MLIQLGQHYNVSGSWFSGYSELHSNLINLMYNSGSGVYTVVGIDIVEEVNENSYPDLYADGARKRVSNTTELETTGSYLISHFETLVPSGSDIKSYEARSNGLRLWSSGSHQEWQVIIDNN